MAAPRAPSPAHPNSSVLAPDQPLILCTPAPKISCGRMEPYRRGGVSCSCPRSIHGGRGAGGSAPALATPGPRTTGLDSLHARDRVRTPRRLLRPGAGSAGSAVCSADLGRLRRRARRLVRHGRQSGRVRRLGDHGAGSARSGCALRKRVEVRPVASPGGDQARGRGDRGAARRRELVGAHRQARRRVRRPGSEGSAPLRFPRGARASGGLFRQASHRQERARALRGAAARVEGRRPVHQGPRF